MTPTPGPRRRWRFQVALLVCCMTTLGAVVWWTVLTMSPPTEVEKTPPPLWTLDHLGPCEQCILHAPEELVGLLGDPRGRHDGPVRSVVFSPDGKRLASGGEDGVVRCWDAETLREREALATGQLRVSQVVFSGDGKLLAAASHQIDHNITVWLWDVTGPRAQLLAKLPGSSGGHGPWVAFTQAGDRMATCAANGRVEWWDVTARPPKKLAELVHDDNPLADGGCLALACTPDGRTLIAAGDGGNDAKGGPKAPVRFWDLAKQPPQPRAALPGQPPRALALTLDKTGKTLVVRFRFRLPEKAEWVEFWRLEGDRITVLWSTDLGQFNEFFRSQALSPDGRTLALGGDTIQLFQVAQHLFQELPVSLASPVQAIAYSPDGKRLAVGDGDGQVQVWLLTENPARPLVPLKRLTSATRVTLGHDGRTLAVSHPNESKVRLWDLQPAAPRLANEINGVDPRAVAFEPDNRTLVLGDVTLGLRLWNLGPKGPREDMQLALGAREAATWLALAPNGRRAVRLFNTKSKKFPQTLALWEVSDLTLRRKALLELPQQVSRIAINDVLVAGVLVGYTGDFEVWLWDPKKPGLPKLAVIPMAEPVTALALRADGQAVACATAGGRTVLWDVSGPQPIEKVRLEGSTPGLRTLVFAPDEKTLAGAVGEKVVLWDSTTGQKLRAWTFTTQVNHLAFAPDGRHLVTANGNGTGFIMRLTKLLPP